jgi:acetyl-CoA C-acetyltransferase
MKTKMKVVDKVTKAESIVDYVVDRDECNRPTPPWRASPSSSRRRVPQIRHAGNASQLSDGVAAGVDGQGRGKVRPQPLGRFVAWAAWRAASRTRWALAGVRSRSC